MANPGTLPVTLVTILLLVAPGYLAVRVFLRAAERNDTLDRTGKIVWSSAASLVSLLLLYLLSPVHFEWVVAGGEILTEGFGVVTGAKLLGVSLSTGVLLYTEHLSVLFLLALLLGGVDKLRGDDDRDRREPWRYAFDDAGAGEIEVFLENGPHIRGEFDPSAWDSSRKGLYLRSPRSLSDGETVPLGQSMLVRSEWITGVVFPEDDPNSEQTKLVDISEEIAVQLETQLGEGQVSETEQNENSGQEREDGEMNKDAGGTNEEDGQS